MDERNNPPAAAPEVAMRLTDVCEKHLFLSVHPKPVRRCERNCHKNQGDPIWWCDAGTKTQTRNEIPTVMPGTPVQALEQSSVFTGRICPAPDWVWRASCVTVILTPSERPRRWSGALWLQIERRSAALHIERHRIMLMRDHPLALNLAIANGGTPPHVNVLSV